MLGGEFLAPGVVECPASLPVLFHCFFLSRRLGWVVRGWLVLGVRTRR